MIYFKSEVPSISRYATVITKHAMGIIKALSYSFSLVSKKL